MSTASHNIRILTTEFKTLVYTEAMLVPIFSLNLKQKINLKQVCAGRFDGRNNCLAGATSSGKVTLFN